MFGIGSQSTSTITRPMTGDEYYADFVVPLGVTLTTNGFRLFVSGTLTLDGTIASNGGDAVGPTGGSATSTGTLLASAPGGSFVAGVPQPGDTITRSLGGSGGAGGSVPLGPGAAGGTAVLPSAAQGYSTFANGTPTVCWQIGLTGHLADGTFAAGGAGGGAGGSTAGTGGGGGGGGGVVVVAAKAIAGGGTISAVGGAGGAPSGTSAGGGGGGGGVLFVFTSTPLPLSVGLTAAGGAGNTGGVDGAAGNIFLFPV